MTAPLLRLLKRRSSGSKAHDSESALLILSAGTPALHTRIGWDQAVVLSVARSIEPDAEKAIQWFVNDPIAEFGGRTARQVVEEGATARLLDMLVAVRGGRRDA